MKMTRRLPALEGSFERIFEPWDLQLPESGVIARRGGSLQQKGGSGRVRYVFGRDEEGEYLEFYAFHRIAGDRHARIDESGKVTDLSVLRTMHLIDPDRPEITARNEREMRERNQALLQQLEEAGLLSGGPVPNSFLINAHLVSGEPDDETEPETNT
jgi:hypothetical protein